MDGVGTGVGGHSGVPGREVRRDPALKSVIPTVKADQDGKVRAATLSDGLHDLDHEAGPVLFGAAVTVGPFIPGRREEGVQQVAVAGVDFQAVEASGLDANSGVGELPHHVSQVLNRGFGVGGHLAVGEGGHGHQLVRGRIGHDRHRVGVGKRKAGHQTGPALGRVHPRDTTVVVGLDYQLRTVGVDGLA